MSHKKIVETSIEEFISFFFKHPNYFLTESDIHCYLFKIIYKKLEEGKLWKNKKELMPLHREYQTYKKYKRKNKKREGNPGHFDLVMLNKNAKKLFDKECKPEIEIAIEVKMNEKRSIKELKRIIDVDLKKLKNKKNKVKHGYFLFFIRHSHYDRKKSKIKSKEGNRFLGKGNTGDNKTRDILNILKNVNKWAKKVKAFYVEYDYDWGDRLKKKIKLEEYRSNKKKINYDSFRQGNLNIYKNKED